MSRFCFFLLGQFLSSQPIRTALMMSKVRSVKDTQVIYYNLPLFWEFIYWQGLKDLQINEYINSRPCQQKLQRPFAYHCCQLPKLLWSFELQLSQDRRPAVPTTLMAFFLKATATPSENEQLGINLSGCKSLISWLTVDEELMAEI